MSKLVVINLAQQAERAREKARQVCRRQIDQEQQQPEQQPGGEIAAMEVTESTPRYDFYRAAMFPATLKQQLLSHEAFRVQLHQCLQSHPHLELKGKVYVLKRGAPRHLLPAKGVPMDMIVPSFLEDIRNDPTDILLEVRDWRAVC